jgi:rare lipoprotein A
VNGSQRAKRHAAALMLAGASMLALPSLGAAASPSGGGGLGGTPPGRTFSPQSSTTAGVVQPGNVTVTATGGGIPLATRASALLRNKLRFSGNAGSSAAGEIVEIERLGRQTGWSWAPTTHAIVRSDGSFTAVWPTNHIGRFSIRAVLQGAKSARAAGASPAVTITVYRPAIATQYGPGFYGSRTACGQILRPHTLGVANRTLKCGTPVAIYYQGKTIVVPVIDRGPYANGADWDLTEATAAALGIPGTATVGAVSLPSR